MRSQEAIKIRRGIVSAPARWWDRKATHRVAAIVFFVLATLATAVAQQSGRPITAAILYLLGVTIVGALEGLRGGVLAAVLASLTYNFFLSEPLFRFSFASAEDYVPLIAFNLGAAASGLVAGQLKDRALAAESATQRMRALFHLSENLQAAVTIGEISEAVADSFTLAGSRAFLMRTSASRRAVLVTPWPDRALLDQSSEDSDAFLNLVSIAVERCLLLEQVSEAELLKRSEEFKSALLSSVSHDLRTPLSAISASASSLIRFGNELAPETRADLLLMIQQQCDRLNRYTTNLLNLVRLRAGVDSTRFTECDALDVLGTAISRARAAGDGRAISKDYEVATAIVRADPVMLEQVFYNVLENAVRYSPAETPINVSAHKRGGWLLVLVEDHGAGIAETDRKRVFERFYRSHAGLAHEGNGLGLSIAKGFTEAFGGSIEASRSQGSVSGTTIKIELPLRSEEQA